MRCALKSTTHRMDARYSGCRRATSSRSALFPNRLESTHACGMTDQLPPDFSGTLPPPPERAAGGFGGAHWERDALERIALAAIREQRAGRRWRIFFRFAFL